MLSNKQLTIGFVLSTVFFSAAFSEIQLYSCSGNNGALKYEVGKSYAYSYESGAFLSMRSPQINPPGDKSKTKVTGKVILTPLSECEFVLTLDEATITTEPEVTSVAIPKSSIRFFMENGAVEDILFDSEEASWSVNIKKAIVSLILNKAYSPQMDKTFQVESGVHGNCETEFTSSGTTFTKTVEISQCGEGEGSSIISQGVPYQVPLVENKNIFGILHHGRMICEQKLDGTIIATASCDLTHDRNVLGNFNYGMDAKLTYTSTMDKATTDAEVEKLTILSTIVYNFTNAMSPEMQKNAEAQIISLLTSLKADLSNKAEIYIELKRAIGRVSSLPDLQDVKEEINRKVFYDALAEVTTDDGIQLLAKLAKEGGLDTITQLSFYTNIAFATKPSAKSLASLTELVTSIGIGTPPIDLEETRDFEENVTLAQTLLLGASGLAHQYCQKTDGACALVPEYITLVNEIAKHTNDKESEMVRSALHALGNLDSLTPDAVSSLKAILTADNSASNWINFLALDAFRRDPCQSDLKEVARNILVDSTRTDEIRIHAYLAVSKCLQADDLTAIQTVFAEKTSSVGGFIGSHVRNIRDSSSPSKQVLKPRLAEIQVPDDVAVVHDKPRASKFIEHSTFKEKDNLGFSLDATIVFIPGVARPQFVSINGTVDLYGRSFNLLEIGLSTRGMMRTMMFYDDSEPPQWSSLSDAAFSEDSYFRIFGTTIGIGLKSLHDSMQMAMKKLTPEKDGDSGAILDMIQPTTFLDGELTYPTLTGLPLTFNLQGVNFHSAKVKATGAEDLISLMMKFESSNLDFKLNVLADMSTTVKGFVGIGANTPSHMGYQIVAKLDQNDHIELEGIRKTENQVEMRLNFPRNVISSRLYSLEVTTYKEINGMGKASVDVASKDNSAVQLSNDNFCTPEKSLFGLKVCQSTKSIKFEGSNPTGFYEEKNISVEKENPEMAGFDILLSRDGKGSYEMVASTPGSHIKRELRAKYSYESGVEENERSMNVNLQAEMDGDKYMTNVKWSSKNLETPSILFIADYSVKIEYSVPSSQVEELLNLKTESKKDSVSVDAIFGGPLSDIAISGTFSALENDTTSLVTKVKVGPSNYESALTYSRRFVYEEMKEDEGQFRWLRLNEGHQAFHAFVSENGQSIQEVDIRYDENHEFRKSASYDFKITVQPTIMLSDDPRLAMFYFGSDWVPGFTNYSSSLIWGEETQANASLNIAEESPSIQVYVKDILKFNGTITFEDSKADQPNLHMVAEFEPCDVKVVLDSRVISNQNEFNQWTNCSVMDRRHDITTDTESHTVIDFVKRTFSVLSKTTQNHQILSKFDLLAQFPEDILNGKSSAVMNLEDKSGPVGKITILDTISSTRKMFNSQLDVEVTSPHQAKPTTFNWKLIGEDVNQQPDIYDEQIHVFSDKKFSTVFIDPLQLEWVKDIKWSKKKGEDYYAMDVSANMSKNGENFRQTDMQMYVSGETPSKTGEAGLSGFTKDDRFKDDFRARVLFHQGVGKELMTHNVTMAVDRTDLTTQKVQPLLNGSVNKTALVISEVDFEMTEVGQLWVDSVGVYRWAELIRLHEKEFTFFRDMSLNPTEGNEIESVFLIDVTAKVHEENHQRKVQVKSNQSLNPNCPLTNFNFTLSK